MVFSKYLLYIIPVYYISFRHFDIIYSLLSGLLCGFIIANGTRYDNENDSPSTYLGTESNLYSRVVFERWRSV